MKPFEAVRMTYDPANPVVSRRSDEGQRTFDYDSAGRITGEQLNGEQVAVYNYGYLDKVLSVVRTTSPRLRGASGGQRTDFHYNASGMLVGKSQGGARLEPWQWDGLGLVARGDQVYLNESHVTGSTGSPQGGGAALMSRTVGGKDDQFLMTDYLGTTLGSLDGSGHHSSVTEGSEVGRANFVRTSFGDGAAAPSGGERFTGKPYDADLGAHVFPYRNYRADLGRWMSADPINFPDGPNQHHYAPVPTMGVDPWGLYDPGPDMNLISDALDGWLGLGWVFAPRRAERSLALGTDENAPSAEIAALKSASAFTSYFDDAFFNSQYTSTGGASIDEDYKLINYGYLSDVGHAYGNIGYKYSGEFEIYETEEGEEKWKIEVTFFNEDKYDFDLNSSIPYIAAFARLQKNGWASAYTTTINFKVTYHEN